MIEVTEENADLLKEGTVVVDFWAAWCGPCKQLSPVFETLSQEYKDVVFAKVDVDASDVASEYGVRAIPTVMVIKNGEAIATRVGAGAKTAVKQWLDEALA